MTNEKLPKQKNSSQIEHSPGAVINQPGRDNVQITNTNFNLWVSIAVVCTIGAGVVALQLGIKNGFKLQIDQAPVPQSSSTPTSQNPIVINQTFPNYTQNLQGLPTSDRSTETKAQNTETTGAQRFSLINLAGMVVCLDDSSLQQNQTTPHIN